MSKNHDPTSELLGSHAVRQMLGGISDMTVSRWKRNPRLRFPMPDFRLSRRNFWKRATVEAWLQSRRFADAPVPATPGHPGLASPPKSRAAR